MNSLHSAIYHLQKMKDVNNGRGDLYQKYIFFISKGKIHKSCHMIIFFFELITFSETLLKNNDEITFI